MCWSIWDCCLVHKGCIMQLASTPSCLSTALTQPFTFNQNDVLCLWFLISNAIVACRCLFVTVWIHLSFQELEYIPFSVAFIAPRLSQTLLCLLHPGPWPQAAISENPQHNFKVLEIWGSYYTPVAVLTHWVTFDKVKQKTLRGQLFAAIHQSVRHLEILQWARVNIL